MMGWQWRHLDHNGNHLHLAPDRKPRQYLTIQSLQAECPFCRSNSPSHGRSVEEGMPLYFHPVVSSCYLLFSSPVLSRRILEVCKGAARDSLKIQDAKNRQNRHLCTIAQLCRAVSSQLRHVSTIGKKPVKQQYLLHTFSQYGELQPTNG